MKKILCATTALVAVGFAGAANAAEPLSVSVGGYAYMGLGYQDVDNPSVPGGESDGFGVMRDGEIYFNATGSSDNGLTFNFSVQLEALTSGDMIDENWGEVQGSFGRVRFGSDDHASYNMATGIAYFQGAHINVYDSFSEAGGPDWWTNNRFSDQIGLHYYTPRIAGFQAGVSYHPRANSDGGGDENTMIVDDAGETATNIISVGANWTGEFSAFDLGLSGGFDYVNDVDGEGGMDEDSTGWNVGAQIGYAGFTLGGFYQSAMEELTLAQQEIDSEANYLLGANDTNDYVGSLTYATGPWVFGAQYGYFETGDDVRDSYDANKVAGWIEYQLAPGADIGLGVEWQKTEFDDEDDIEGIAGMVIMGLSF